MTDTNRCGQAWSDANRSSLKPTLRTAPVRTPSPLPGVAGADSIDSRQLLGNARTVAIRHGTETYTLRETRAGKLILTK